MSSTEMLNSYLRRAGLLEQRLKKLETEDAFASTQRIDLVASWDVARELLKLIATDILTVQASLAKVPFQEMVAFPVFMVKLLDSVEKMLENWGV